MLAGLCCKGMEEEEAARRQGRRAVSHPSLTTSSLAGWVCTML